ncbi:MAG: hypothetical protein ACHQNT_07535 [Bacteroidia bacterium]
MRMVFHFAHPAHFHLFKNVVASLRNAHEILISYNDKDVLDDLIKNSPLKDIAVKIESSKKIENKFDLLKQFVNKNIGIYKLLKKFKPDFVAGTSIIIAYSGKLLGIKSIIVNEDDFNIIKKTAIIGYPFATHILCPDVCQIGKWNYKSVKYKGYHELSYLHPRYFIPDKELVRKYFSPDEKFFLLRFAKLVAHHDVGIRGIDNTIAENVIKILEPHGKIFISSERTLPSQLEKYHIKINPLHIHHVMAFASIFIGDSQTMAAESGIMGVPFIRFNDFAGRLSYLDELENKYMLGYAINPDKPEQLYEKIRMILSEKKITELWQSRKTLMLNDKIDVCAFMTWFFENYPDSAVKAGNEASFIKNNFHSNIMF